MMLTQTAAVVGSAPLPELLLRRTVPTSTTPLSRSYTSLPLPRLPGQARQAPTCTALLLRIPSPDSIEQSQGAKSFAGRCAADGRFEASHPGFSVQ